MPLSDHAPAAGLAAFLPFNLDHHATIQHRLQDATSKGYESICLPLTSENWKLRWEGMCLLPAEGGSDDARKACARAADLWRQRPCFLPDEVTLRHLDQPQGIIAMISEWLQLDADDDGIRHDAEIASLPLLFFIPSYMSPGPETRTCLCLLPQHPHCHSSSSTKQIPRRILRPHHQQLPSKYPLYLSFRPAAHLRSNYPPCSH